MCSDRIAYKGGWSLLTDASEAASERKHRGWAVAAILLHPQPLLHLHLAQTELSEGPSSFLALAEGVSDYSLRTVMSYLCGLANRVALTNFDLVLHYE